MNLKIERLLSILLLIISFHSFVVGIGLIFIPISLLQFFNFSPETDRFFLSQGGVFHIAMSVCYAMAACNKQRFESLIIFSVIVKAIASVFLFIYLIFISSNLIILFSAVTDMFMGILIWILYRRLSNESYFKASI